MDISNHELNLYNPKGSWLAMLLLFSLPSIHGAMQQTYMSQSGDQPYAGSQVFNSKTSLILILSNFQR